MPGSLAAAAPVRRDFTQRQAALIIGFVLLLVAAGCSSWLVISNRQHNNWVVHSELVRSRLYRLLSLVQEAETGQRGYLLTGDAGYLTPFDEGRRSIPPALDELRGLVADNAAQLANLAGIEPLIAAKLAELERTIAVRRGGDAEAALAVVRSGLGNALMQQIRRAVGMMQDAEEQLMAGRAAGANRGDLWLISVSLAGVVLATVLALGSINHLREESRAVLAAEQRLRAANETLEARVEARTADLREANDELQRFAYIVGHDLRAPLVNIMGFTGELEAIRADISRRIAELPDADTADRDFGEALGFIKSSTSKMDRLLNAILRVSRAGRRNFAPEPIDTGALLEAVAASLRHQLGQRDAVIEIAPDLPPIVADRIAIEQVFTNLVDNAVKYLAPGRPGRITITGRTLPGGRTAFDVRDNGRGIAPEDLERVFELFRRAGVQDQPGEGIGLAFVRAVVRRMGGTIDCVSTAGEGSTFRIIVAPPEAVLADRVDKKEMA